MDESDTAGWFSFTIAAEQWSYAHSDYNELMLLIDKHTHGNFSFSIDSIYFEEEKDAIMFGLYFRG